MSKKQVILLLFISLAFGGFSFVSFTGKQSDDYVTPEMKYEDRVYSSKIRSVQLHTENNPLSQPIINISSPGKLELSFDELDADYKTYSYTFIHCNSNWEPSRLLPNEYIDGFQENLIEEYQYSMNTIQKYVHYSTVFPNDYSRLILSGNYLLKVYENGNSNNVIITKRFMVFDNQVTINATASRASNSTFSNYYQEIDFVITYSDYDLTNPYSDLKVVLCQNNRWDNARRELKPLFVKDGELTYNLSNDNVFPGGNEFRNINIQSIQFKSDRVQQIISDSSIYHIKLYPDDKRSFKNYEYTQDLDGNFLIKNRDRDNSNIEADYCYVHLFLPLNDPDIDGNLYVFGAYNGWTCNRENMMHYNENKQGYEGKILLKQGYYNYVYALLKDDSTIADETYVEGTHYETENQYTIYVYHTKRGTYYEQLIGVKHVRTGR